MIRYLKTREMRRNREDMRRGYDSRRGDYRGNDYRSNDYRGYDRNSYDFARDNEGRDFMRDERDGRGFDMRISRDYARGRRRDYGYDGNYDYGYEDYDDGKLEKEYEEDLCEWIDKTKRKDRIGLTFDQVIQQAQNMGINFREFSEKEFYATYLIMTTDYYHVFGNDPQQYLKMAKVFFEDDDIKVSPKEKLCIYFYKIIKGE